ncbi:MAG: tRNA 2-thiouridine(34) synthase MnmA [Candidatus Omnitrophota bacterium]|jgi:tRNA-specific 2-thiouridylase
MGKIRVVVAMSGGVDSSVAAALLKDKGYEVIGITMCFFLPIRQAGESAKKPGCCSLDGIDDARRVANKLGIKHYILNMQKFLEKYVIKDFCAQYLLGRTPNPCILCNQYLKFGELLKKALALDAKFLATGHYAQIVKTKDAFWLGKAKDLNKDQSYFLYRLNQEKLKHIIFPIGKYTKEEVRKLARNFSLPVAEKVASQEVCFVPQDDYRGFLKTRLNEEIKPGLVMDQEGNIAGRHSGIAYYTVGQREGLGIAKGYPAYISKIDHRNNQITIGRKDDVLVSEFLIKDLYFSHKPIKKKVALKIKIRYNHKEREAELIPFANKIRAKFKEPQFAITPGQAAVFYSRSKVIGGGVIDRILK